MGICIDEQMHILDKKYFINTLKGKNMLNNC